MQPRDDHRYSGQVLKAALEPPDPRITLHSTSLTMRCHRNSTGLYQLSYGKSGFIIYPFT